MENRKPVDDGATTPSGERPDAPPRGGFFSLEELLLLPNAMSFLRLPLALIFPFAARSKGAALAVIALAGLTDVLDGYLARERGEVTATGATLDPLADKAFALSVVATLLAQGKLPAWGIPALLAREILEAPLLFWVLSRTSSQAGAPARPGSQAAPPAAQEGSAGAHVPAGGARSSTRLGKAATVAQFAAVAAALGLPRAVRPALVVTAALGTASGILYWRRELRQGR